jgi:hypothetical protein
MRTGRVAMMAALALASSLAAFGGDYKYSYPEPCGQLWGAVKTALGDAVAYSEVRFDEASLTADYQINRNIPVKHNGQPVQVKVSGWAGNNPRQVVLKADGPGCSLQTLSHRAGLDSDGHKALKARIDAALDKEKAGEKAGPGK